MTGVPTLQVRAPSYVSDLESISTKYFQSIIQVLQLDQSSMNPSHPVSTITPLVETKEGEGNSGLHHHELSTSRRTILAAALDSMRMGMRERVEGYVGKVILPELRCILRHHVKKKDHDVEVRTLHVFQLCESILRRGGDSQCSFMIQE